MTTLTPPWRLLPVGLLVVALLLCAEGAAGQASLQPASPAFGARVDSVLAEQMEAWHVPGAVVAVVESGEVVLLEGYGVADAETGQRVDPERTLFHVASLSKPVTASAVLQLVGQGRLGLRRPVNEYLSHFISISATS